MAQEGLLGVAYPRTTRPFRGTSFLLRRRLLLTHPFRGRTFLTSIRRRPQRRRGRRPQRRRQEERQHICSRVRFARLETVTARRGLVGLSASSAIWSWIGNENLWGRTARALRTGCSALTRTSTGCLWGTLWRGS